MSIMSQFSALALDAYTKCSIDREVYRNLVGNVNYETNLAYGKKVSEEVANFVSTGPISEKMGEANKLFDYVVHNCDVSERILKASADYNQNIYDSLDLYKNTAPHSIPVFGEGMTNVVLGLGMMGVVAGIGYLTSKYNNRIHI
jgi:hypothetical protein